MFGRSSMFWLLALTIAQHAADDDAVRSLKVRSGATRRTAAASPLAAENLAGGWQLFLPAGFEHRIVLRSGEPGQLQFEAKKLVFSGTYERRGDEMVLVKPDDPNLTGFVWKVRSPHLMTLVEQSDKPGGNYLGAVLFRSADIKGR